MAKILLDTSIIIEQLHQKEKPETILNKLFDAEHDLYISIVTHTEAYAGKSIWERESAKNHLEKILSRITILSLEKTTSETAGKIRAEYNLATIDAIIAATALTHKLPLATLNLKHFKKVNGLKLLKHPQN